MADKISIPIESKYDDKGAKKALADAKELDKLKPEIKVTADTKPAVKDIDGLMKKVDKLDADAATILLTSNATAIANDITDLIVDLDKLDANDPQVDVKAAQINDLKGDLDQIEAKVREVNNVPMDLDTGKAVGGLKKVHGEADQSRSVLANMVGNATQDMGALGGVAGTAGVAIGQLGEYATEGNIKLADLAKVAGPMLGLAAATQLLSAAMEAAQASRAFDAANVKQYFDALTDGTTAVESFNEEIRKTGELSYRAAHGGGPLGMFSSTKDLLPVLEKANIDVAQFNTIVADLQTTTQSAGDAHDRWRGQLEALNVSQLDAIRIVKAASQEADTRTASTEEETRVVDLLGKSEATLAEEHRNTAAAADVYTAATEAKAAADERATQAIEDHAAALKTEADALNGQVNAATDAADAQIDANKAFKEYGKTLGDNKASADDVRDAAIRLAKASQQVTVKQAEAAGTVASATAKLDSQNRALLGAGAAASGPARQGIVDYIAAVNGVPPQKITDILALMDQGKIAEANDALTKVSHTRTASVHADADTAAADNELDRVADKKRVAYINTFVLPPGTVNDRGGFIGPGGGLVAERRPELVRFPGSTSPVLVTDPTLVPAGSQVTSGSETERILAGGGGSPSITVNMRLPTGWRGDPLAEVHRTTRRTGRFYNRVGR